MPGYHFHVRGQLGGSLFERVNHPLHAAPAGHVDERESVTHEVIAHVHYVVLWKEDYRVPVGVSGGKVQRADVFSVEMHGHVVFEGDHRQRPFRCRFDFHLYRPAISRGSPGLQALSHVILRDHR